MSSEFSKEHIPTNTSLSPLERQLLQQDRGEFSIISPQSHDSTGTEAWRGFLDNGALTAAWLPPADSPYRKFAKTKTMDAADYLGDRIVPRYSPLEGKSEYTLLNLINNPLIDEHTAIILDSGGPHSVAMAAKLAETGRQPVVMFDTLPVSGGLNRSAPQELAVQLYYAQNMKALKDLGKIDAKQPPVFVLDLHRNDYPGDPTSYEYTPADFPTAEELQMTGIKQVLYLTEADQHGEIQPAFQSTDRLRSDLKVMANNWSQQGIEMLYTGIYPADKASFSSETLNKTPENTFKFLF